LPCNDGLNPIREIFPLLLREAKIRTKIQDGALPGASLSPDGFYQLIGVILMPVSIIGMRCSSDKHGKAAYHEDNRKARYL